MTGFVDVLCPLRTPENRGAHFARYHQEAGEFICQLCGVDLKVAELAAMIETSVETFTKETDGALGEIDPKAARDVEAVTAKALAGTLKPSELCTVILGWARQQYPGVAVPYLRRTIAKTAEASGAKANRSAA